MSEPLVTTAEFYATCIQKLRQDSEAGFWAEVSVPAEQDADALLKLLALFKWTNGLQCTKRLSGSHWWVSVKRKEAMP